MLGTVLGSCMSSLEGLNAAYLPQGVDESIAQGMVARATVNRPDVDTYSILVVPNGQSEGISSNAALKYRQGNRLAVVVGRHPDLGSFTQSFQEILGPNYPEGAHQEVSMAALSRAAILEVLGHADISPFGNNYADSWSEYLESCLQLVANIQRELRQGTESWNVYWFMQVDAGLKRMGHLLRTKKEELPSIDSFFENYTYASFGLPYPANKNVTKFKPRDFAWAFQEHWSDETTIASTVKYLEHHAETKSGGPHALDQITWMKFNQILASTGNQGIAFAQYAGADEKFVEGLCGLNDRQFVNPIPNETKHNRMIPEDDLGRSLSVEPDGSEKGPFVALSSISELESIQVSEVLRIKIPTLRPIDYAELQSSSISLRSMTKKLNWDGEFQMDEDGGLWAVGSIYRNLGKLPWKAEPKSVKLNVSLSQGDSLFGAINSQSSVDVHLIFPEQCGLWTIPIRATGSLGRPRYWGEDVLSLGDSSAADHLHTVELDSSAARCRYIIWASGLEESPQLGGAALDGLNQRAGVYVIDDQLTDFDILQAGESRFECRSPESGKASQSPIVAAIARTRPSSDPLDAESLGSLRGVYETFLTRSMEDASWLDTIGHLITAEDREFPLVPDVPDSVNGLLMSDDLADIWPTVSDLSVPEDLINSEAADEFRVAFTDLDLPKRMKIGVADTGEPAYELPSKTSWRSLWTENAAKLERYLEAYAELIVAARHIGNPAGIFWATYPMSVSVWETRTASTCKAVLLSPLHPIRLAWLSGVESTLWDSNLAEKLAGTVEGWNFPLVGPRETEGGRLIAVALESGQDQVFLGWSILVRASIDGHASLLSPEKAGDRAVPGTAVSGLNATAVSAALRSYRKINPQVSTMTIDLAAHSETNRLTEVDEAILTDVGEWNRTSALALVGGVRVWDSIKRAGDPPQEKMTRLIQANAGVPLVWTRYASDAADMKKCNVRILEDAGVQVEVKASAVDSRLGTLGSAPLRRFEAVTSGKIGTTSVSSPTFREDQGWEPLSKALRECEGASSTTIISTKLFQANVISGTADWTVSGEALMNPSAMASVVQHASSGAQMLWEWRPPFLEKSSEVPALERRPFVSVARVPFGFREQIKKLLSKARGEDVADQDVDILLGKLGARGVGLSSMLSMGGTHASGALGFFLVFALVEQVQAEMDNTYVLPIDACDSFLRALAGGSEHADSTRRADVLILRLEEGAVTLAPIEIKFYGLGAQSPQGNLPNGNDSATKEPLNQAYATQSLLERIGLAWSDIRNSGSEADKVLWANGLAALVEAAIRLQPVFSREPEALAKSLSQVVQGSSELRIGRPLIAFFKHGALTTEGNSYQASYNTLPDDSVHGRTFGLLAANSAAAFAALGEDANPLKADWEAMIHWSLANARPVKPSPDVDTPQLSPGGTDIVSTPLDEAVTKPSAPVKPRGESLASKESPMPNGASFDSELESPRSRNANTAPGGADDPSAPKSFLHEANTKDSDLVTEDSSREVAPGEFVNGIRGQGIRFPVGRLLGPTTPVDADFWPSNTDLNQMNVGVVGDLGTGKTQLMKALVYQLRKEAREKQESPLSMLIFDYKRDFQDPDFLGAVGGKVLRINNIPLNFFQLREGYTPMTANQRANEFIDVLDKIYGGIGPVQKDRLSLTITDLYRENRSIPPTLGRILSRYSEDSKPDAVTSILRKFVSSEVFTEDVDAFQSFADIIENNVLIVALNDFGTDDDGKNSLVVMFLNLYYDYMLSSRKWPFVGEDPQLRRLNSFLLVDEAVNIIKYKFPVLMNLLLQGREFGFGVMLASQYLSHFKKDQENYGEPLLTWFIHKVKSASPKDLQQLGLGEHAPVLVQRILNLSKHQALYSSLGHNGRFIEDIPFFKLIQKDDRARR